MKKVILSFFILLLTFDLAIAVQRRHKKHSVSKLKMNMNLSRTSRPATFDIHAGIAAVENDVSFAGTNCAQAISRNIELVIAGKIETNVFDAWHLQEITCNQSLLKALALFAIAAIDPEGKIIVKSMRGKLAFGITELYNPVWSVSYHNSVHAADLIQKDLFFRV